MHLALFQAQVREPWMEKTAALDPREHVFQGLDTKPISDTVLDMLFLKLRHSNCYWRLHELLNDWNYITWKWKYSNIRLITWFLFSWIQNYRKAIYVPAQDLPFELFFLFLESSGPCSGMLLSWNTLDNYLQASLCVILMLSLLYLGLRPAL